MEGKQDIAAAALAGEGKEGLTSAAEQIREQAAPSDAGRPGGWQIPVPGRLDEREHIARQYRRAREQLIEAMRLLDIYEEAGIKPCNLGVIHPLIRSSFGY